MSKNKNKSGCINFRPRSTLSTGGDVLRRHDAVRDALATWTNNLSAPCDPACVCCHRTDMMIAFSVFGLNGLGHTQLAYLSLARLCDMEPRRSVSSAALVDELGSDSQKFLDPSVALGWKAICAYS